MSSIYTTADIPQTVAGFETWLDCIRDGTLDDVEAIGTYVATRLTDLSRHFRYHGGTDPESVAQSRMKHLRDHPPGPNHILKVFAPDGEIRGACHLMLVDQPGRFFGYGEVGMSVQDKDPRFPPELDADFQHRHVGHALLFAAIEEAKTNLLFRGVYSSSVHGSPMKFLAMRLGFAFDMHASMEVEEDVCVMPLPESRAHAA